MSVSAIKIQDLSMFAPYVHSDIRDFNEDKYNVGDIGAQYKLDNIRKRFEHIASTYLSYADILEAYEQDLYQFCGPNINNYQDLNKFLFGGLKDDGLQRIAQKVLQDPEFLNGIAPKITQQILNDVASIFKDPTTGTKISNLIYNQIQLNQTSVLTLSKEIIKAIRDSNIFNTNTKKGYVQIGSIQDMFNINPDILTAFGNGIYTNVSSSGAKFNQLLKQILAEKNVIGTVDEAVFKQQFIKVYMKYTSLTQTSILEEDAREAAQFYADSTWFFYQQSNKTGDFSNIKGDIGERTLEWAFYQKNFGTKSQIIVETIGNKSESQTTALVLNRLQKFGQRAAYQLKEFHDPSKQGMSDNLITIKNNKGTKTFRVQSKNYGLMWFDELDQENEKVDNYIVPILEDGSTSKLIKQLYINDFIDYTQGANIAYYVANMIWFYHAGSIQHYQTGKPSRQKSGMGNLGDAQAMLNRLFGETVSAFLGITYTDMLTSVSTQIKPEASNIFYYLGNAVLFPVSQVLREVAKQLQGEANELFHVRYTINMNASGLIGAADYYNQKRAIPGGLVWNGDYSDPTLLSIGQKMGLNILQRAQGHVNLYFHMSKILRSAYSVSKP